MNRISILWAGAACAALLSPIGTPLEPRVARAAEMPAGIGVGAITDGEEVEANRAPAIAVEESILLDGGRILRYLEPTGGDDRGSYISDGGLVPSSEPNALEEAKLEMARAAVEASRIGGTLHAPAIEVSSPVFTEEEIHALKLQRLSAAAPAPIESDPAAGVGEDLPAIQETGPAELTPEEAAKVAAGTAIGAGGGAVDAAAEEEGR